MYMQKEENETAKSQQDSLINVDIEDIILAILKEKAKTSLAS